jgi:putative membrane protein
VNIQNFFSDEDKQKINSAITDAEKKTSAEIVPVLTDASGAYDRAEDMFGLLLAVAAVAVLWLVFQGVRADAAWTTADSPAFTYNLCYVLLTFVAVFIVGTAIATKVWFIRNLFCTRSMMKDCVAAGAARAFQVHNLTATEDDTGILIYVSLFEHMVHVMGDGTIAEKLTNADFQEVKDAIIAAIKKGERGQGLCEGIRLCGEKLAGPFPIKEGDVDELPNQLMIWEQKL